MHLSLVLCIVHLLTTASIFCSYELLVLTVVMMMTIIIIVLQYDCQINSQISLLGPSQTQSKSAK